MSAVREQKHKSNACIKAKIVACKDKDCATKNGAVRGMYVIEDENTLWNEQEKTCNTQNSQNVP